MTDNEIKWFVILLLGLAVCTMFAEIFSGCSTTQQEVEGQCQEEGE